MVGLGYVGLPLAVQAAEKGHQVMGVDLNDGLIELVNNRVSPFINDDRFADSLGKISATALSAMTSYERLREADSIAICVPTPTENNIPDMSYVKHAATQIGRLLRPGQLISLESTVNPGVTRDEVLPILEQESGMDVGWDFNLVHCPERVDPGNRQFFVGNLNRVVGGITPNCTDRAVNFYTHIIDAEIIPLGSTEEAEFVKSWENSHRNVMIAMANSAAIICDAMGMSMDNVLRGLQSKVDQFGLQLASPGIGPGGHCIPEDIHYVIKKARQNGIDTRFLDDAADLNDKMPQYAVHRLTEMIRESKDDPADLQAALLGLAYKPNVGDMRRSPSIEVGHQLMRRFNSVVLHDPYAEITTLAVKGASVASSIEEALDKTDALFIGTAHPDYIKQISAEMLVSAGIRFVLDGRNCLDEESIKATGISYRGIGR